MMNKLNYLYFIAFVFLFSSCASKKIHTNAGVNKNNSVSGASVKNKYAQLLGVANAAIDHPDLYQWIDNWVGTPYQYGGSSMRGIDCSAFAATLENDIYAKKLPRSSAEQAQTVNKKYIHQLAEGDLVFFSFGGKSINHVGVYLQNGRFVHASTSKGVIVSNLNDPWYKKYFVAGGTVK